MDSNKYHEICKSARALQNNISYASVKEFLEKFKIELNINCDKLDLLISNILSTDLSNESIITLPKLNLKYKKTSKEYWLIRGWDEAHSIKKAKEANQVYSHPGRLEKKGYSQDEIKKIVAASINKGISTLKKREDYSDIVKRRNLGLTKYRYINTINPETGVLYTPSESEKKYKEDQKKASKSANLSRKPESFNTKIEYYLAKGLSLEAAQAALFERQIKNGLNYYINKYGIEKGSLEYEERILKYSKQIKTLRSAFPEKWKTSNKKYSDSSKRFFDSLINEVDSLNTLTIYYANNEHFIYDTINKKIYFYDFYVKELNIIIEYHGLVWHPRKRVQEGWMHPYTKETSEKYYDLDIHKKSLANNLGIDVITIFEDEITTHRKFIIDELHSRINAYCNIK
jgi:predicted nuclease with TOPRIM domain